MIFSNFIPGLILIPYFLTINDSYFDPGAFIPKAIKFPRPKEMLIYQLEKDPDCMGRIEAAQELVKGVDLDGVQALGRAALTDPFWGVQAEAAEALSQVRTNAARDSLVTALAAKHPKARAAIAKALGTFKDEKVSEALKKHAEKDESYFVEAQSVSAWATSRTQPVFAPKSALRRPRPQRTRPVAAAARGSLRPIATESGSLFQPRTEIKARLFVVWLLEVRSTRSADVSARNRTFVPRCGQHGDTPAGAFTDEHTRPIRYTLQHLFALEVRLHEV